MSYVGVFLAVFVADGMWTLYVRAAADGQAIKAATYSTGIVLAGGFTTIALASSSWYLIPACLGAFAGTWVAAR